MSSAQPANSPSPASQSCGEAVHFFTTTLIGELRAIAAGKLAGQGAVAPFQPTELVNEAWLKLARYDQLDVRDRVHAKARAAKAMHQVLIDQIRADGADKRPGRRRQVMIDTDDLWTGMAGPTRVDALALHEALVDLAAIDPRAAQVIELRFFGGLTLQEIGDWLGVSGKTANTDWNAARAWLAVRLGGGSKR